MSFDYADAEGRPPGRSGGAADAASLGSPLGSPPGSRPERLGQLFLPEVEEAQYASVWSKAKITAALIRESDLDPSVAEEVAASVEQKVIQSCVQRVSTSLLRELVDNELFERGFDAKLKRQQPIGLPKYNLEQIIFGTDFKEGYTFPKTPSEVRDIIANRILHQYSLEEVFSPSVADAHRDGRLFIHRLSDPIRCSRLCWDIPPPAGAGSMSGRAGAGGSPGPLREVDGDDAVAGGYLDLGDFFRRLAHLTHFASEEVCLGGLSNLLLDPLSRGRAPEEVISHVLDRLSEASGSQASGRPEIVLELALSDRFLPWLRGLVELPSRRSRRLVLSLSLSLDSMVQDGAGIPVGESEVAQLVAELYSRGDRIEFQYPTDASAAVTPGVGETERPESCRAGRGGTGVTSGFTSGFTAVFSKVTVNLPRAAYRSGKDRRGSIEDELDGVLDLAIRGHLERRQFALRLAEHRECPLWELLGKQQGRKALLDSTESVEFTVGLVGLNECVKFLTGRELHQDPVALSKGRSLVEHIYHKLARESRGLGLRLRLEETNNLGPLHALERADRRLFPEIAEIDRGRPASAAASYTDGVRVHRSAPVDPLRRLEALAIFLPFVRPAGGIIDEVPELRSSDRELFLSLLEESVPALLASRGGRSGAPLYS